MSFLSTHNSWFHYLFKLNRLFTTILLKHLKIAFLTIIQRTQVVELFQLKPSPLESAGYGVQIVFLGGYLPLPFIVAIISKASNGMANSIQR